MASTSLQSISDVSFTLPSLDQIIQVLTLQAGFNSAIVVVGATLLGIASGTIGVFALLRNRALMADALAHSALPGLGIAFLIGAFTGLGGKQLWLLLLGATVSGILGVICIQLLSRYTRLHEDTAIGAILSCFFGAGVVVMSLIQSLGTGEEGGLAHFIYGQTAAMNQQDTLYLLGATLLAAIGAALCLKEFRMVCFDEDFASSDGWPVSMIDLVMMSLVVMITVIGLQSVGLLLIVAFLVIPPAGARFWTEDLKKMIWCSAAIGGFSGYFGSALSALLPRFPAGAVIVLVAGALFFFSFFFAPNRGIIASLFKQIRLGFRITEDHFLRAAYELVEQRESEEVATDVEFHIQEIPVFRNWPHPSNSLILHWFSFRNLIQKSGNRIRLTDLGFTRASQKVRNHRLWEEYIVSHTLTPVSHVDYSADLVEHVLSAEIVKQLEEQVVLRGSSLPKSIHPISVE